MSGWSVFWFLPRVNMISSAIAPVRAPFTPMFWKSARKTRHTRHELGPARQARRLTISQLRCSRERTAVHAQVALPHLLVDGGHGSLRRSRPRQVHVTSRCRHLCPHTRHTRQPLARSLCRHITVVYVPWANRTRPSECRACCGRCCPGSGSPSRTRAGCGNGRLRAGIGRTPRQQLLRYARNVRIVGEGDGTGRVTEDGEAVLLGARAVEVFVRAALGVGARDAVAVVIELRLVWAKSVSAIANTTHAHAHTTAHAGWHTKRSKRGAR
jgi:hypothetical protein